MGIDQGSRAIRRPIPKWDARQDIWETVECMAAAKLAVQIKPLAEREQDVILARRCPKVRERVLQILQGNKT